MAEKGTTVAGDLYESITAKIFEIGRQLRQKNGYPFNPHQLNLHLQNAIEGKFSTDIDPRFEFLGESSLTVPEGHKPKEQLKIFKEKYGKNFSYYNDDITDQNFPNPTHELIPGKTYKVKKFGIKKGKSISSEDGLALLKSQNAYLVGAQGASVVYQLKRDELPKGKFYISFDEKDALLADTGGRHRVPRVRHNGDGDFGFDLGYFGLDCHEDFVVLCLCD